MYARTVKAETLTFGVSGKLIMNALVMYDRETETLWSQFLGEAVEGELLGERLTLVPSRLTTWGDWKAEHPDTLALDTGSRPYDPYASYYISGRTGIIPEANSDERLSTKELVLGLVGDDSQRAYAHSGLEGEQVVNDVFEGAEIVVVRDEASRSAGAFNRRVGDRVFMFEPGDAGNSEMVDAETGSTWSKLTGVAVTGELEGERLDTYPSFNSFWFGWSDYYPNTEVWVSGSVDQ